MVQEIRPGYGWSLGYRLLQEIEVTAETADDGVSVILVSKAFRKSYANISIGRYKGDTDIISGILNWAYIRYPNELIDAEEVQSFGEVPLNNIKEQTHVKLCLISIRFEVD